jgi:hypothetical protein
MPGKVHPPPPPAKPGAREKAGSAPLGNGKDLRRAALADEPPETAQPQAEDEAREAEASEAEGFEKQEPAGNGNLHHEIPTHPGVPLAPPGIVPESDVRTHSPAAAAPQKEHGAVEELGELPRGYADGRLVALIRDPHTVFVYWDLSQQQIEQAFGGLGPARAALRFFNPRGGELVREVEVHLDSRGWYVRELPSALEVRVELWAQGEKGARLLRAARPIKLPPSRPSDVLDEFYATVPLGSPLRGSEPVSGGRPLAWKAGGAPIGWERRMQPRHPASSRSGAPRSGEPQNPPEDDE